MVTATPQREETDPSRLQQQFADFIANDAFPCVMAKSLFRTDHVDFHTYAKLGDPHSASCMLQDLHHYLEDVQEKDRGFYTFIATFPEEQIPDEPTFETKLWNHLQHLHDLDPEPWDPTVSPDPKSQEFSFSILGTAFYIVGMHPQSSRLARQSPCPALVLNLHAQFEELRSKGAYQKVKDRIQERDKALQGTVNPMLKDFGTRSEARQYSGRQVDDSWQCPFHHKVKR